MAERSSQNFEFLGSREQDLARVAALAEAHIAVDPNAAIVKLRLFGELLARHICEQRRIRVEQGVSQETRLRILRDSVPRDILSRLHDVRQAGNAAAHSDEGTASKAIHQLKIAHSLAGWYQREFYQPRFSPPPFQAPRNQAKSIRRLEKQLGASQAERQAELEKLRQLTTTIADNAEKLRLALARTNEQQHVADEANKRHREVIERLERTNSISRELLRLKLDEPDAAGLPDWVAAVAQGAPPPHDLPEELLEDIRRIGEHFSLPTRANPEVTLSSTGTLTAGGEDLQVTVGLRTWDTLHPAIRSGTTWTTIDGETFLMDPALAEALDDVVGPLPMAAKPAETTRERELWWGRLRRRLQPFGVQLTGYLKNTDAVVVERFEPHLRIDANGHVELTVSTPEIDAEQLTATVDQLRPNGVRNPTVVGRTASGEVTRQRVLLAPSARKVVHKIQKIRQNRAGATPYLLDDPALLLDDDAFDLSKYGERVIGLGVPVYRASPTLMDTASSADQSRISLRDDLAQVTDPKPAPKLTPGEEEELATLLSTAAAQGRHYVRFKELWIRVPSTTQAALLDTAVDAGASRRTGVLIIEDNLGDPNFLRADEGIGVCADVPEQPPGMTTSALLPHQRTGFSWLAGHSLVGPNSTDHGLLADEMGLGKTLQVLALMSLLEDAGNLSPTLVVAPLSVLQNWEAEADRFFAGKFRRRERLHSGMRVTAGNLRKADVVLASYESVRTQQLELGRVRWRLMVCDESHRIKNPTTQTTRAVMAMDAERRIAMTGTPVQNSLDDLWSQFDWLQPGLLGDLKSFRQQFGAAKPESERAAALEQLRNTVKPRMLRRLKSLVAVDLPQKTVRRIELPLRTEQAQLYTAVLREVKDAGGSTLAVLHRLFGVCCHPEKRHSGQAETVDNVKLTWLMSLLDEIRDAGEKVVIFAEWYALQDQLSMEIARRYGITVDRINGQVAADQRQWKVDEFNATEGFAVMTLGPRAAGIGLNITAANHVVHYTRHWNPALEAQATDRCHRIGQTRPVTVYLPITTHPETTTVEQHLDKLLRSKEAVARDVIVPTDKLSVEQELRRSLHPTD